MKECVKCINTTKNPSISINEDGLCNICADYEKKYNKNDLEKEFEFIKKLIKNKKYDAMVAYSGGKDSSAMLYSVKQLGFTPLAFTFDIKFNNLTNNLINKMNKVSQKINVDYEIIDIRPHINDSDKESFEMLAELYEEPITDNLKGVASGKCGFTTLKRISPNFS